METFYNSLSSRHIIHACNPAHPRHQMRIIIVPLHNPIPLFVDLDDREASILEATDRITSQRLPLYFVCETAIALFRCEAFEEDL
jgi:hypothetical protein